MVGLLDGKPPSWPVWVRIKGDKRVRDEDKFRPTRASVRRAGSQRCVFRYSLFCLSLVSDSDKDGAVVRR